MLRENATIVVARNERWRGTVSTEPVECGWACEAIFFARVLERHDGAGIDARVQISPDGMHWVATDVSGALPGNPDDVLALPVAHFGNWLRLVVTVPEGAEIVALITLHLK